MHVFRNLLDPYIMCRHSIEWEATLLIMYQELGEEWVPNSRNKLFEKEESLFKKMTEVREVHICMSYRLPCWLKWKLR